MYNDKTIEDVLKFLYEQKKEELAKVVLNLVKENERNKINGTQTIPPVTLPQIWYGDDIKNQPYTFNCSVGGKE